jgi:hypothetical protein
MRANSAEGCSNNVCEDIGYMIFSNINNEGELVGLNRHVISVLIEFLTLNEYVRLSSTNSLATHLQDFRRHPYLIKTFIDKVSCAIEVLNADHLSRGPYLSRFRHKAYQFVKNSTEDDIQQRLTLVQISNLHEIAERLPTVARDSSPPPCNSRSLVATCIGILLGAITFPLVMSGKSRLHSPFPIEVYAIPGAAIGGCIGLLIDYYVIDRCHNRALLRALNFGASVSPNSADEPLLQEYMSELSVSHNTNLSDVLGELEAGRHHINFW